MKDPSPVDHVDEPPVLPTLSKESRTFSPEGQQVLMMLYQEVSNSWGKLLDIRFKLLGLVPSVSLAILITLLTKDESEKGLTPITKAGITVFGLLVTIALFLYDKRNSELFIELMKRGAKIEEELGIDRGQFRGRLEPSYELVNHRIALNLIYFTAIAGWVFAILATFLNW